MDHLPPGFEKADCKLLYVIKHFSDKFVIKCFFDNGF